MSESPTQDKEMEPAADNPKDTMDVEPEEMAQAAAPVAAKPKKRKYNKELILKRLPGETDEEYKKSS